MTKTHPGSRKNRIAHAVPLDTPHPNGFAAAGIETCWSPLDHSVGEMHDVFIIISQCSDGAHIARTVYAASDDDARLTHQENYPGEPIVAVHQ